MLEAYSTNIDVAEDTAIPFNSTTLTKGCTVTHPSADTFNLNKCGVYMIGVDTSSEAEATIQLFKDGVAQGQAQSTGGSHQSFVTLVQCDKNNSCCPCASPTSIQIMNTGAAATLASANICITKVC